MTSSAPYAIMLRRDGDDMVVEIDTKIPNKQGDSFVVVIRASLRGEISHIVEPLGIEMAMQKHYN